MVETRPARSVSDDFAIGSLRRCALFAHADDAAVQAIARGLRRRRFRRDEIIFHEGDPGDSLHILATGSAKVVLSSMEGDEAIIATLRPGDFFGELALLDGGPRSATVAALEQTETMSLPRDTFQQLLHGDPRLLDALLHGLAHELRRITRHVEELHFLDLAGRLAMRLTRLAREQDSTRLDWPYTQSDLASMIGGGRQSVNKLLSSLVDDGLVRIERDLLIITDVDSLARRAER